MLQISNLRVWEAIIKIHKFNKIKKIACLYFCRVQAGYDGLQYQTVSLAHFSFKRCPYPLGSFPQDVEILHLKNLLYRFPFDEPVNGDCRIDPKMSEKNSQSRYAQAMRIFPKRFFSAERSSIRFINSRAAARSSLYTMVGTYDLLKTLSRPICASHSASPISVFLLPSA